MYNTGTLNLCSIDKQCLRHTQILQSLSLHYVVTMTSKLYSYMLNYMFHHRYYIIYSVHVCVLLLVHVSVLLHVHVHYLMYYVILSILSIVLNIVSVDEV